MTAIPTSTLTALKASLANGSHGWAVTGYFENTQTITVGESSSVQVTRTYQLTSSAKNTVINATVKLVDGVLNQITVTWRGQSWTTTDAALRTQLETMASPVSAARAAELDALLA